MAEVRERPTVQVAPMTPGEVQRLVGIDAFLTPVFFAPVYGRIARRLYSHRG